MNDPSEIQTPIKVFVSYTHDSPEHDARVLELSNSLRKRGFDSDIDQYHANQRWPLWMEERIAWADFVVVICTETYLRRWNADEKPGVGLGAQWESFLTRQCLYNSPKTNDKFVPVIFEAKDKAYIPTALTDVTRVVLGVALEGNRSGGRSLPLAQCHCASVWKLWKRCPDALGLGFVER